jgi:hypothetical protein
VVVPGVFVRQPDKAGIAVVVVRPQVIQHLV